MKDEEENQSPVINLVKDHEMDENNKKAPEAKKSNEDFKSSFIQSKYKISCFFENEKMKIPDKALFQVSERKSERPTIQTENSNQESSFERSLRKFQLREIKSNLDLHASNK